MVDNRIYILIDDLLKLNDKIYAIEILNLEGKRLYKFSKTDVTEQNFDDLYQDLNDITRSSKTLSLENIKISVIDKELSKIAIVNISNNNFLIIAFCQEVSLTDIVDVVSYLSNAMLVMKNKQAS
jgi:Cdc6-like AAA superfamily ATPase